MRAVKPQTTLIQQGWTPSELIRDFGRDDKGFLNPLI